MKSVFFFFWGFQKQQHHHTKKKKKKKLESRDPIKIEILGFVKKRV